MPSGSTKDLESTKDLDRLCEVFPNVDREQLQAELKEKSLHEAISHLVGENQAEPTEASSSSTHSIQADAESCSSVSALITYFASAVVEDYDSWITAEKEKVWPRAIQFYKSAKFKEKRLRGRVCIEYVDEEGIDAGAIRGDFFEKVITELNQKLFEGNEFSRLPKKDQGMEQLFEIGGMMVAHSVIHGGPSLACINPTIHHYLLTDNIDESIMTCPLQVDDIPLNAGTFVLITLIKEVNIFIRYTQVNKISTLITIQ